MQQAKKESALRALRRIRSRYSLAPPRVGLRPAAGVIRALREELFIHPNIYLAHNALFEEAPAVLRFALCATVGVNLRLSLSPHRAIITLTQSVSRAIVAGSAPAAASDGARGWLVPAVPQLFI